MDITRTLPLPLGRLLAVAWVAIALLATPACGQSPLLSVTEFRDAGVERIRASEPTAVIEARDAQGVTVTIPDDPQRTGIQINFQRAYDIYRNDPSQLDALLDQWAHNALVEVVQPRTRENLVVVVRGRALVTSYDAQLRQGEAPTTLVTTPFLGDLFSVLAFDTPRAIAYATPEQIADLGLSADEAWLLALSNLDKRTGDLRVIPSDQFLGVSYVEAESGLAPSFLLHSEICNSGAGGDLILVGTRDGYFVSNPEVSGASGRLRNYARSLIARGESESTTFLTCENGRLAVD